MKHAYLILAHSSKNLLKELIQALDDVRNDIYVHLDKKAKFDISDLSTKFSDLHVLPERLDARWGDYSLVEVELLLMAEASKKYPYAYYHLLSGVDFPIANQNVIHDFFKKHSGKEFIGFANHTPKAELKWRSQHYFLFSRNFKTKNLLIRLARRIFADVQTLIGLKRYPKEVKKGCQWCSITNDFVQLLLSNKALIRKYFNHTYCPDELFIQTLCWNSSFRNHIYNVEDEFKGCLRYINWDNGEIHLMDNADPKKMVHSDFLFARKFSEDGLVNIKKIQHEFTSMDA